jgi:hypothetical protein
MADKIFLVQVDNLRIYRDKDRSNYYLLDTTTKAKIQLPAAALKGVLKHLLDDSIFYKR